MLRTRRARHLALAGALALLLSSCRDPDLTAPSSVSSDDTGPSAIPGSTVPEPGPAPSVPDPRDAELDVETRELVATLTDAGTAFEQLARASDLADAAPITPRLLATLSADPRWSDPDGNGVPDELGVRPLLPGPDISREEELDAKDAFSAVLAAARDAGSAGAVLVDILRDPVTGDLGAWQRDPGGLLDGIVAKVRNVRDVAGAERAISELQGEGPKALAWALLADGAVARRDLQQVRAYGERGAVHVQLMLDAVRPLLDGPDAPA